MSSKDGVPQHYLVCGIYFSNMPVQNFFFFCAAKYYVPKLGSALPLKPFYSACFPDLVAYNISTTGKMQVAGQ